MFFCTLLTSSNTLYVLYDACYIVSPFIGGIARKYAPPSIECAAAFATRTPCDVTLERARGNTLWRTRSLECTSTTPPSSTEVLRPHMRRNNGGAFPVFLYTHTRITWKISTMAICKGAFCQCPRSVNKEFELFERGNNTKQRPF